MQCLECKREVKRLDNEHLAGCSGLTLQEYAFRHSLPLDVLVPNDLLNYEYPLDSYPSCDAVDAKATLIVHALRMAGLLSEQGDFCTVRGDIRRLDQLLWLGHKLASCGFCFHQEYVLNDTTHRVVALNRLRARKENLQRIPSLDTKQMNDFESLRLMTVLLTVSASLQGGYVFLSLTSQADAEALGELMQSKFDIGFKLLRGVDDQSVLLRTLSLADAGSLLSLLRNRLLQIPGAYEYYYNEQPEALVAKELVFDSAHFITDHPGKCANLHGGRYKLIVKVYDRVDPHSGFVIDYGYLKQVVEREVIEKLDHKSLNLADPFLAWRSSTEYLSLFVWSRLIEYLPNLFELQTYETDSSYCCFQGPTLDEIQNEGQKVFENYFASDELGQSRWRSVLSDRIRPKLRIVRDS